MVKLVKNLSSIPNTHLKAAYDEMCPESQPGIGWVVVVEWDVLILGDC